MARHKGHKVSTHIGKKSHKGRKVSHRKSGGKKHTMVKA